MYRFLAGPKWILSHVFVLVLIVTMVNLGLWQLRRLDERQTRNELIESRSLGNPVGFQSLVASGSDDIDPKDLEYRIVNAVGTYDPTEEFVVINRTQNGGSGYWIVTPLVPSGGGDEILVLRGFVSGPVVDTEAPIDGFEPETGEVSVSGWIMQSREGEGLQSKNSLLETGEWTRVDIDQYSDETSRDVAPVYIQLGEQLPASANEALRPVPLPELDDGPHLGYAGQWFIFSLIAAGGYVLILRKVVRERRTDVSTAD